jgi:hypothetical protein
MQLILTNLKLCVGKGMIELVFVPISKKMPEKAEQPGPPVSQSKRGSSLGLFSDSIK